MGKPAARIGDMHTCPMVTPGLPSVPHVGGPITGPCVPTVLIGGKPAAVMGDMCTCVGPPATIILGSTGVFIGGKPAARIGDPTAHGGMISVGCPTVLIGESAPGAPKSPTLAWLVKMALSQMNPTVAAKASQIITLKEAAQNGTPFCEKCAEAAMLKGNHDRNSQKIKTTTFDSKTKTEKSKSSNGPIATEIQIADRSILTKYGKSIPDKKKKPPASEITVLQPDDEFKSEFKKRHPNYPDDEVKYIFGEQYKGEIFINKDKNYEGTLVHENFHYYTDNKFKKKLYTYKGVKINEGATEYFTRQTTTVSRIGHYDTEYEIMKKFVDEFGEETLKDAYFRGDKNSIKLIMKFVDGKDSSKKGFWLTINGWFRKT